MVAVIIIGLVLTAMALALATRSSNETSLVALDRQGMQAKLLLDGATARARARVTNLFTTANSRTNLRPMPDSVLSGVPPLMSAAGISRTLTMLNPLDGQPANAPVAEEALIAPAGGLPYYQYAVDHDLNPNTPGVMVRYYISELPASNPLNAAQANPQNPFGLGCTAASAPVNNWCSTGLSGLGFVKTYRILAVLPAPAPNQPFQAQETFVAVSRQSLFNFAVLYATDLEIGPGGGMTIRGNVHTEGNAYLYSAGGSANSDPNSALVFRHLFAKDHPYYNENDSQISVIKNMYQGRKSRDSATGSDSQNAFWFEKNNGTDLAKGTRDNDSVSTLNGFTQGDVSIASKGDGKGSDDTWAVDPDWASKSKSEFDGRLKTGQTGATSVNIPNADQIDPQNPASSFQNTLNGDSSTNPNLGGLAVETDAGGNTRIKKDGSYIAYVSADGREYNIDASGSPLAERNSNQRFFPEGTFTQADFFNGRESPTLGDSGGSYDQKKIKVTDIDINKLGQAKIRDEAGNAIQEVYPANGLVYATRADAVADSDPKDFTADKNRRPYGFRLKNGAKLPGSSLTFATNNPVYVQGDFNKHQDANGKALDPYSKDYKYAESGDTWKTAVILSDALTVLSNNWKDSENKGTTPAVKSASDTEINAMLVTGTTESNPATNDFSGGLQNFPRLLENWNSRTLKIRGSFVQGWLSRYGTGRWNTLGGSDGGGYYTVPRRDWGYDTNFLINPDPVVAERFPGSTTVGGAGGNRYLFSTRLSYQDYMRRACTNYYGPGSRLGWETQESCNAAGF